MSAFEESIIQRIKQLEREVERLQKWERPIVITDHGTLAGLADNDHPQYLLTTDKAADSDKLDGLDSTAYANPTGVTSYTSTLTGWAATPSQSISYVMIGKLMILFIYISGTSNSTAASMTLPTGITAKTLTFLYQPVRVENNGAYATNWGMAVVTNNSSTIQFFSTQAGATFTASGTKTIRGTLIFTVN